MENTRISTTGSFPDELNASKLIMRLVQMDCRYDEAPLREFVRVPENESPHPQAGVRNRCGDDCVSRPVARRARAIRCGWHRDHRRAYRPDTSAPSTR